MRLYSLVGRVSTSLCEDCGYREEWKSGVISANYHGFDIQSPVNLPMHPFQNKGTIHVSFCCLQFKNHDLMLAWE